MDFFDVMFGKKYGAVPFSKNYFDTLFAAKLAQLEIKTLTGTLPLTFRTSETALRYWIIYGNNTQHNYSTSGTLPLTFTSHTAGNADDWSISGNDDVGKNLLSLANHASSGSGNWTFDISEVTGEVIVNGTATGSSGGQVFIEIVPTEEMQVYFSASPSGGSGISYNAYMWDTTAGGRCKKWNGVTNSDTDLGNTQDNEAILPAGHTCKLLCRIGQNYVAQNVVFKPMLRLPDTSADFEPYQVGVGQRTANIFTDVGSQNGYLTDTGSIVTPHANLRYTDFLTIPTGATTITFDANFSNSPMNTPAICFYDASKNFISGETYAQSTPNPRTFTVPNGAFYCRTSYRTAYSKVMLVEGSTAPANFVPYGYEIPLTVNNTPQDIYIGSEPLTAGQSVSKTSTGVDIAAIAGTNTITTELYNKPEMSIEGVDYVGVGEPINDSWQIPLAVTCDRNLFNIYGNMAYSGGVHLINYNVETSSVTGEMPADSYYILGIANAIVKGDETFVISFDKSTAGTAELRMTKGTGSSAEIIETFDISEIKSYRIVFECEESFGNVYPRLVATEAATNTFEHIMIKKASDKGGFVPYGAKYEYNVPIDAPLTEGQSVTDTVTISTFEGENVIDTTLTNKPQMTITYKGG